MSTDLPEQSKQTPPLPSPDALNPDALNPVWRLPVALALVLLLVLGIRSYYADQSQSVQPVEAEKRLSSVSEPPAQPSAEPIAVLLRAGEKVRTFQISWQPGMTALEATRQLANQDASLRLESRGTGDLVLVTAIGDQANEGLTGLNWQYEVNGEYQNRGAAACPVAPGDRVLWKYAPYE